MPAEMVLLCDEAPTAAVVAETGRRLFTDGELMEYLDGQVRQWVAGDGRAVLSLFAARKVEVRADADRAVEGGTGQYRWWVDMTAPHGDAADGWSLARAVAVAVDGRVARRS